MDVAVVALRCLGTLEPQTANSLLGIGLTIFDVEMLS